jgi:hypothetical protein
MRKVWQELNTGACGIVEADLRAYVDTRRKTPLKLREMIERINPVIRGWGTFYRKANVRLLFHRLDGWIERRLYSFLAKRWRNGMWRRYPSRRLIDDYGLVRLTHLIPSLSIR